MKEKIAAFIILFLLSEKVVSDSLGNFIAEPKLNHKEESLHNPLIHINTEDRFAIDYLEASFGVPGDSFTILPRGFYDTVSYINHPYRINPFLNGIEQENFWQIISSAGFEYYFANRKGNYVPGNAGTLLDKYSTFSMFQSGSMVILNSLAFYWHLKETNYFDNSSWESFSIDFHRVYAKLKLWKISSTLGKDTVHLGPGEYGMLLSGNAAPFWMIKFQNDETIRLWGHWNFIVMKGWLKEERTDVSNPEIFAIRMTYRPNGLWDFFELGMTRTIMYGGDNKYRHKIVEYPKLISGYEDNVPRSIWDGDSFGGIDFTVNIPFYKIIPELKVFKFYFEESGTDINAIWQIEDLGEFSFPYIFIKFFERAYLTGIFMGFENDIMRIEYTKTAYSFYKHHIYFSEGYSYKGLSLGHPIGNNHQALKFNHRHFFNNRFSFKWEIGFYQLFGASKTDHKTKFSAFFPMFSLDDGLIRRGYFSLWTDWLIYGHIFRGYFSLDGGNKSDGDINPSKIVINKKSTVDITFGVSVILKF